MNIGLVGLKRRLVRALVVVAAVTSSFVFVSPARADLINIMSDSSSSTDGLGSFTGTIAYSYNAIESIGELTVTLTNTSDPSNGGLITGLIFNINSGDANASATLDTATHPFLNAPNQSGVPFGDPYDAGAALGGSFLGGGSPAGGIVVGATGTFTFDVTASDASSLTAMSFITGPFEHDFLVRFKGFENGGSDKVPAQPGPSAPGPSALTVLACGMLFRSRRRAAA